MSRSFSLIIKACVESVEKSRRMIFGDRRDPPSGIFGNAFVRLGFASFQQGLLHHRFRKIDVSRPKDACQRRHELSGFMPEKMLDDAIDFDGLWLIHEALLGES
jgi:hypothetical protein